MASTAPTSWTIIRSIDAKAREMRRSDRRADLTPYYLELLSVHSADTVIRSHLRQSLSHEYQLRGNFEAATTLAIMEINDRPLHPLPLLSLVSQKLYAEEDPAAALPFAIKAVAIADSAREFRRHARANLLRVASALKDAALVEKCLNEIMDLDLAPGEPDVAPEADLLVHAKAAGVELSVLHGYRSFLGSVLLPVTAELPQFTRDPKSSG